MSLTRIGSIGINTGIAFAGVTTIVTLNTANDALSIGATVNVGSGITLGASGDIFATGVSTVTTLKVGSGVTVSSDGDVFFTGIATGNASGLTALNASNISSGTVPTARLGSGTASSSTFLRGDSTFQTVSTDLVDDTTPQLGGNLDNNGKNITFGDSAGSSDDRLTFGAGTDLSIYHDNSNSRSRIEHSTDNALEILQGGNAGMLIQNQNSYNIEIKTNAEDAIKCVANGAVELYYNNNKKAETTNGGIQVTGSVACSGGSSNNLSLPDNGKVKVGTGDDLAIYHDGNNSVIQNDTGDLYIQNDSSNTTSKVLIRAKGGENSINVNPDGAVELYHDNSVRAETMSSGFKVTRSVDDNSTTLKLENNSTASSTTPSVSIKVDLAYGKNGGSIDFVRVSNYQSSAASDSAIVFKPAKNDTPTEVVRITEDYVRLHSNSSGIQFNSDTADANALDDYEEGTWNPQIGGSSAVGSYTRTSEGYYIKVGKQVTAWLNCTGSVSGASGHTRIYGLPFTAASNSASNGYTAVYSAGSVQYWSGFGSADILGALIPISTTYIYFHTDNGSSTGANQTIQNGGHNAHVHVSYFTD